MTLASTRLAIACLFASACLAGRQPHVLDLDPRERGFEVPRRPVLIFFVDGLRADVLEEVVLNGDLPRLQRLLLDRAARVRSAVTCVPSVTYANAVTMLTGCWPSTHGVWANACFDRQQLLTRNYETDRQFAADDACRPTLFELYGERLTAGVALPFERGVKISRVQSVETGGLAFGTSWMMGMEEEADETLAEQLDEIANEARSIGEWPALVVIHLPGVDAIGHEHGSDGEEYRQAIANLDEGLGAALEAFERGGMLDELTIILTSDHGHHAAPDCLALEEYLAETLGAPFVLSTESDGHEPFLRRWERYAPFRAVVTPCGMREATVHLRTGESWNQRPGLEEILTFPAANGTPPRESLPERLLRSPAIQFVAVRAGEHAVRLWGRSGAAELRLTGDGRAPAFSYEVLEGRDPLGYDTDERLRGWMRSAHDSREWLETTADQRHPDLVPQLVEAFEDRRSGDVVLFAAPGWDFSCEDYLGGHGGLEREEMIVPLIVAGPGIRPGAEVAAARLVDLVPTVLELAGVELEEDPSFDGVSFAAALR